MKLRVAGLHLQLLGLILLPFSIILLVVALLGVQFHQGAMRRLIAERDERATRAAAAALSEQLHHREFAVRGLAARFADRSAPSTIIADAEFLAPDFDAGIAVMDNRGEPLASSIPAEIWGERPIDEVLNTPDSSETVFTTPFLEGDQFTVMVAVEDDERVAVGAFTIARLFQTALLSSVLGTGESSAFLTDAHGNLLQHVGVPPAEEQLLGHPGVESALRGEFGSFYLPESDGEHVVAFSPVEPVGWGLIVEEPWKSVSSPLLDVSLAAPLALVPAFLVTVVGLWFGARQVIQPLRELQEQAEQFAFEDATSLELPVGGIAEIQHLQETLIRMSMQLRSAREALQDYIGAITEAQEEERHRLARDLHDETIQDLIAVDQRIQMLSIDMKPDNPDQSQRLDNLHRDVNRTIRDVRRLTRALRPVYLEDLGLIPAIEMVADDLHRDHEIPVDIKIEGSTHRLKSAVELAVFRIVQEALSNIGRHSSARTAQIFISFDEGGLEVEVRDDGSGFEVPLRMTDMAAKGHFGLMGIHERADLIGAKLTIESDADEGTQIQLKLEN
jgi:signal transduction histidine kinase